MNKQEKQIEKILREYLNIPADIERRASIATYDLYFGPYDASNLEPDEIDLYPSFGAAIDTIKNWIDSNVPSELWIDLDCDCVQTSEPEGYTDDETGEYIEPYLENTYQLNRKDILGYLFNKELVYYL